MKTLKTNLKESLVKSNANKADNKIQDIFEYLLDNLLEGKYHKRDFIYDKMSGLYKTKQTPPDIFIKLNNYIVKNKSKLYEKYKVHNSHILSVIDRNDNDKCFIYDDVMHTLCIGGTVYDKLTDDY